MTFEKNPGGHMLFKFPPVEETEFPPGSYGLSGELEILLQDIRKAELTRPERRAECRANAAIEKWKRQKGELYEDEVQAHEQKGTAPVDYRDY